MALRFYMVILVVVLTGGIYMGANNSSETPANPQRVRLQDVTLPEDGLALYQTLLREIPEVVSEILCACCNQKLTTCYEGFCPPT